MKRLFLMKNPEGFQGEKYLKNNKKNYFEGWYFKNISNEEGISFIPGININEKERKAFIQVITNDFSVFINYDIDDFEYSYNPFYIKVGKNYFSKERIHIDIKEKRLNLFVYGDLKYSKSKNINTSVITPNIMGPFSYIPFMQCNHAILSMRNKVNGFISINSKKIKFSSGVGYIEKDFGCSFPKYYVWMQGNKFRNNEASFMVSIADIPFKLFNFRGLICSLILDDVEYRFATYNNSKILRYEVKDNFINIVLKKGSYLLNIKSEYKKGSELLAPVLGNMNKSIFESIDSIVQVTLKKKEKVIFDDISTNCGLEIVYE